MKRYEKKYKRKFEEGLILFGKLQIGDTFTDGKSKGAGIRSNVDMWQEYEKVSKSQAKCIGQYGYGNTRAVGSLYNFSHNKPVVVM